MSAVALSVPVARVEAVFCSCLQPSDQPTVADVRFAISNVVRAHGAHWCAAEVAREFGDHPETAAARMRWAREVVAQAYARPVRERQMYQLAGTTR